MATCVFSCGCYISSSMFGDHEIMSVVPCRHHINAPKIQEAFLALAQAVGETVEEFPVAEEVCCGPECKC